MGSVVFDRIADRYDETRGGVPRGRRLAAEIADRLEAGRTLEVGVGTGAVALGLRELGVDVVGADLSRPMLERARARLGDRVVQADALRLPVAPGSCANVVTVWVLHLVADPAAVIAEVARVLRPGGRYVDVSSRSMYAEDDLRAIIEPMVDALRSGRDQPEDVVAAGEWAGLVPVELGWTAEQVVATSPNEQAAIIEARTWSSLWDLPDPVWERTVRPAVTALRALPEPDRPRSRRARLAVTVLERPERPADR